MSENFKYLIVILDQNAPGFCYYETDKFTGKSRMDFETFEKVIKFAKTKQLIINLVKSGDDLDEQYKSALDEIDHIIIEPLNKNNYKNDSIKIIDLNDFTDFDELSLLCKDSIITVRIFSYEIAQLKLAVQKLMLSALRINLVIKDIQNLSDEFYHEYGRQLDDLGNLISQDSLCHERTFCELGFLTDRMGLLSMNNCNAGIVHITVVPNGKFYLCPGFYFDDENNSIGSLDQEIQLKNIQLLTIEKSPICNICDCFQCKRCIYLNKKLTLEINIPSEQQCLLAHTERNAAGKLLSSLHKKGECWQVKDIELISYLDPINLLLKDAF